MYTSGSGTHHHRAKRNNKAPRRFFVSGQRKSAIPSLFLLLIKRVIYKYEMRVIIIPVMQSNPSRLVL